MNRRIKIGTIPKSVEVDGRIKLAVGKRMIVKETYSIIITEINDSGIKAKLI